MIRIVTRDGADPGLVGHVLASVPAGAMLELLVSDTVPAGCARIDATTTDGCRHRVVAVTGRCEDVCALLDACHAHHVVQLPAAGDGLRRLLARAA